MGWNIGANDAANCIGTSVGSGLIRFRHAVLLMTVCVVAGAVLQGHHVMKTIGKGIVICDPRDFASPDTLDEARRVDEQIAACGEDRSLRHRELIGRKEALVKEIAREIAARKPADHEELFAEQKLPDLAILVALLSAGLFVTLATFSRIPVSTSQAIVGGVFGVGIGMVGFQPGYFQLAVLWKIVGCWVVCPFLTMILSSGTYVLLRVFLRSVSDRHRWNAILAFLVLLSAGYVSYSLGMNDVGNAIGPLLSKYPDRGLFLALFGGVALAVGAVTFGKRVTETVGKRITPIDLHGALAAQVSAASAVYVFSMMGIPVSTSQAIVGAVIGVGLVRGARAMSKRRVAKIAVGWVGSPLCAALFAAVVYALLAGRLF